MLPSSTVENYLKAIYQGQVSLPREERLVPMGQVATSLGVTPPVAMFATKRRGGRRHIGRPARDHREDRAQKVLESAPALPMPVRTESGTATGDSPVGKGKSRIDTGKIG